MRACANCGWEVPDAATSCQNCGYPIGPMPAMRANRVPGLSEPVTGDAPGDGEPWSWLRTIAVDAAFSSVNSADPAQGGEATAGQALATGTRLVGGHLTVRRVAGRGSQDEDDERVLELNGQEIKIGRSPACEIALGADVLVSRRHAVMTCSGDGYGILDLGSSNGTLVNDAEIHALTELHDGDRIAIGEYLIVVSAAPARMSAPAIPTRVTSPLPDFPFEDTDPLLATIAREAGDAASSDELATATFAPECDEQQQAELSSPAQDRPPLQAHVVAGASLETHGISQTSTGAGTMGHPRDLSALQDQLTGMIQGLRQQAEEDARMAASLRQTLLEIQQRLSALLGTQVEPASAGLALNVDRLAELARQTAQNPRHLDYILSLSERADDLSLVLEAVQRLQAGGGVVEALQALRMRVEQALA